VTKVYGPTPQAALAPDSLPGEPVFEAVAALSAPPLYSAFNKPASRL
jgi:hypothetical protein